MCQVYYCPTEGRAYWILDDLSPVRQLADVFGGGAPGPARPRLLAPRPAVRYGLGVGGPGGLGPGGAVGQNAPAGATLDFWLPTRPDSTRPARLEILGDGGAVLRRYPTPADRVAPPTEGTPPPRPAFAPVAGHNRVVWDLRTEGVRLVPGLVYDGSTAGWVVPPGTYTVRLVAGADTSVQTLDVRDPPGAAAERASAHARRAEVNRRLAARVDEVTSAVLALRDVRDQVRRLAERAKGDSAAPNAAPNAAADAAPARRAVGARAADVVRRVGEIEAALVQTKRQTFQDVVNFPPALLDHYLFVARQADEAEPTTQGIVDRLTDLDADWARQRAAVDTVMAHDVADLNRLARDAGVEAVVVPAIRTAPTASR